MSAPRFVNTSDGTCWTRREESRGGEALYAPEKCGVCPEFVMATYAELEAHGVVGTADVLPVPVGPVLGSRSVLDRARDALGARMSKDDLRLVLENTIAYAAGLEAERRSTNEALSDAAEALRARPSCPCPSEGRPHQVGCPQAEVPSPLFPTVASLRQASSREEPHDSPLHRDYKGPGHDLDMPSAGGDGRG